MRTGQKQHGSSHVFGPRQAPQRSSCRNRVAKPRPCAGARLGGIDQAGRHAVHAHALRSEFGSQVAAKAHQRRFGSGVVVIRHHGVFDKVGRDVHDGAAGAACQVGQGGAAHMVGSAHRPLELRPVVVPAHLAERRSLLGIEGVGRQGVVHHHVQPAKLGDYSIDQFRGRSLVAYVGLDGQGIATGVAAVLDHRLGRCLIAQVVHSHGCPMRCEGPREGCADAAPRAGDDTNLFRHGKAPLFGWRYHACGQGEGTAPFAGGCHRLTARIVRARICPSPPHPARSAAQGR